MEIIAEPRTLVGPPDAPRPIPPKQVTTGRIRRVMTWDGWRDASGDVLVQIEQPHPRLEITQTVRALGMLQRPAPASNPGQFDWASYYRRQRVLASFTIPRANNIRILEPADPSPLDHLRRHVRRLLAMGFEPQQSLDHTLLRALLVGDGDPELRDIQDQFKRTGTSHHLAISGLHVAVLGGVIYGVCRLARMGPRPTAWVTLGFVIAYGLVALPSPPVVRSVLLCATFAMGIMGGRMVDGVQLLSVTAIAMLLYHPLDLFDPGFQLSFGTVLGLMLLTPAFTRLMQSFRDRDMMLAPKTPGQIAAAGRWVDGQLLATLVSGIVAWLVSMPLIAWHFGQINPWAIVASIALAIPVFVALIFGLAKVVLTFAWPSLAGAWADVAAIPIGWMRSMLAWLDAMPGASVPLPAPPWYLLAACYGLLLLSVFWRTRPGLRWMLIVLAIGSYATILAIPVRDAVLVRVAAKEELRVTLLSVGAGQCAVVEPPGGRTVVLDAGSTSLTDLWRKCLGPFLHARSQTVLDTVIVSHGDADHTSGVADVVGIYSAREVIVGSRFIPNATDDPGTTTLLAELDAMDRPPRIVAPGDVLPLGRDTRIQFLWPGKGVDGLADNDSGLVLKLNFAGRSILFPADIQDAGMTALLAMTDKIKADVLVAPHHGSSEKTTGAFVAAVDPAVVLSSNDRTLSNKQRRFETLIGSRPLYRTNVCGAVTVIISRDGTVRVEPFQTDKLKTLVLPRTD
jgi:competence protein ComEC